MSVPDNDFVNEMRRIYTTFGEKSFGAERLEIIRKYIYHLSSFEFRILVNKIISSMRYAPLPSDFRDLAIEIKRAGGEKKDYSIFAACKSCQGDGFLNAEKESGGRKYSFAFRCPDDNCAASKNNCAPYYPKWSSAYGPEYSLVNI